MLGLTVGGNGGGEPESPVRVVVIPSQSSYFAGEPFSVTITFTNTHSQEGASSGSNPKAISHGLGHKRGAHSISSAPLARPPTSPGNPRNTTVPNSSRMKVPEELPKRKGFIGSGNGNGKGKATSSLLQQKGEVVPELIEQRRNRQLLQKSLSVSISPYELEESFGEGVVASSAPYSQRSFQQTPTTPHVPSPLARTDTLSLSSSHPHVRKQSVLDGDFTLDVLSPTTSIPPSPYTPTSSTSTFSLALDPIAEATHSPYPSTPAIGSPTIEPATFSPHTPTVPSGSGSGSASHSHPPARNANNNSNSVYAYPPPPPRHTANTHRPTPIGLGQPSSSSRGYPNTNTHPKTAFASTFPPNNTELILYSYAQLTGTVLITPVPGALPTPDQAKTLNALRSGLLNRAVLGGGSMDISATLNSSSSLSSNGNLSSGLGLPTSPKTRHLRSHTRSSSFSAGLLSMLSPTSLVSSMSASTPTSASSPGPGNGTRWRSASNSSATPYAVYTPPTPTSSRFANGNASPGVGSGFGSPLVSEISQDEPLPTLELQPAMLAVDLALAPGESRTYTYTIKLPDNLPPTFKGKSLKFSYELVVGTCRAGPTGGGGGVGANSISRVMKVPIRLYNHISVGRSLKPYDLLWPISRRQDVGMPGTEAKVVEEMKDSMQNTVMSLRLPSSSSSPGISSLNTLDSIRDYARALLASLPEPERMRNGDSDVNEGEKTPLDRGSLTPTVSSLEPGSSSIGRSRLENGISAANGNGDMKRRQMDRSEVLRRIESEKEKANEGELTGCREAVEILTRNPKKCSYDVNKDGVKVAVLTFAKSAYRLGETISGIVEVNDRTSRARVLKLSAILESHETLPSTISPLSSARHLRRSHAEYHSSFTLNTLRTTFSLDIPSDASPAFQIRVGTPPNQSPRSPPAAPPTAPPTPGGLEWKVRLCLLVGIASDTTIPGVHGVRFKSLTRDGMRGEWGSSWRATPGNAPLVKPDLRAEAAAAKLRQQQQQSLGSPRTWSRFIMSSLIYGNMSEDTEREYHDGDIGDSDDEADGGEGYDGIIPDLAGGVGRGVDYAAGNEGWRDVKLETVECEVPVRIFPGNTAFKALDVVFDV